MAKEEAQELFEDLLNDGIRDKFDKALLQKN
jgi:hypothetical protein